jgi:hypothetical protein
MIEKIEHQGVVLSIIIRFDYVGQGINFFTPDDFPQQVGYMKREKDYVIPPHVHNAVERKIYDTQEVLLIKSGKVRVDYYDDGRNYLRSRLLKAGDVVLLAYGGHGFVMLEDSEIIEVKQGPYVGDSDKTRFSPVDNHKVRVES